MPYFHRFVLVLSLVSIAACGPEPGTPDYVLAKLREGHVVGGKNLELLGAEQMDAMITVASDPEVPPIAREQLLERAMMFEGVDDAYDKLVGFLDHPDPVTRIITIRWLARLGDTRATVRLIERFETEPDKERAVKTNLINAMTRIGANTHVPDQKLLDRLVAEFERPDGKYPRTWARILGAWRGETVTVALEKALESSDKGLQEVAAQALTGPAVRDLGRIAPVYVTMLDHPISRVRSAGLTGLTAGTYPGRITAVKKCKETPTLALLDVLPDLPRKIAEFLAREDIEEREKTLAEGLRDCLASYVQGAGETGAKSGDDEP